MVRSEFYNGASVIRSHFYKIFLFILYFFVESTFSVLLIRGSWFVYSRNRFIHIWMNLEYGCFITLPFMRWPIDLYILEFYIIDIFFSLFLSPLHLSVYSYCFTTHNQIRFSFFFMKYLISVAIIISPHISFFRFFILTGSLYPDNAKRWVGY